MRCYALRLHEVGMINSSPNRIIAEGTDWRFVNELKRGGRSATRGREEVMPRLSERNYRRRNGPSCPHPTPSQA